MSVLQQALGEHDLDDSGHGRFANANGGEEIDVLPGTAFTLVRLVSR